jgi:3-phosphoshikimate 1-carboxyvinyltransferase
VVEIDASASSQFVSGLLLSGAAFADGLTIVHTGESVPSAPHIAMTVSMMRDAGVEVDDGEANRWRVAPGPIAVRDWIIEPDLSNAVPFLAAAVVSGGIVRVSGGHKAASSRQDIFSIAEAEFRCAPGSSTGGAGCPDLRRLRCRPARRRRADACCRSHGEALSSDGAVSHLSGDYLRGTRRTGSALCAEINGLGGQCEETPDGLRITSRQLHGGVWRSYADHRMATAGAIVGLRVPGIEVEDIGTTAKTLPEFPQMWAEMLKGQTAESGPDARGKKGL